MNVRVIGTAALATLAVLLVNSYVGLIVPARAA
jgi:hypothetical protein